MGMISPTLAPLCSMSCDNHCECKNQEALRYRERAHAARKRATAYASLAESCIREAAFLEGEADLLDKTLIVGGAS